MKHLIVLPAFNEEDALPDTLAKLQRLPDNFELLIVNDGSSDRTGAVADRLARTSRLACRVVHLPMNCGIGGSMQTGYLFAARRGCYGYVIQFDADGQHDASYVQTLVRECEEKNLDLAVGSRFLLVDDSNFRSSFARRLGIAFFLWLIRALSGSRVSDPTSGFRCAGPRAWQCFARQYPEDYPEPESLFWCVRNRLRIGYVPVRMHERRGGVSSIRRFKAVYYMLKVSLSIFVESMRGRERVAP